MTIRLDIRKLQSGKWAAFTGKTRYYLSTVKDTEQEARVAALHRIGQEAQERIDAVDLQLEAIGALDQKDPHGYLA